MDKMTNVKALAFVLTNCTVPADVKEKLEAMKASLEKKSSGNKKQTAKQEANDRLMTAIVDGMETNRLYSVAEISAEILGGVYTSQKISALLKKLIDSGAVIRTEEEKRKPYFQKA